MKISLEYLRTAALILGLSVTIAMGYAQETALDLTGYYAYPVSIGVSYQGLSPISSYQSTFSVYEISGNVRLPFIMSPSLHPILGFGMVRFDSLDLDSPETWDHYHLFGSLGLAYSNRFARNFELGVELSGAFSLSYFPSLLPDHGTMGEPNIFAQAGLRVGLVPSYGLALDLVPSLRYLFSLGPLKDFDGVILGLGLSAQYRFGDDPDSSTSIVRSLSFSNLSFPPVFAAMQSYYARKPLSSVTITNTDRQSIADVELSFYQSGYMDGPTPLAAIASLEPGQSVTVEVMASFNQAVFATEGITPLVGEILATYKRGTRLVEQRQSVPYDLYDRTAVIWDDDRKAAAFITPADSALRNFASFIRQACKDASLPGYSSEIQFAIQAFSSLSEIGIIYQVDPSSPYASVSGDTQVIDSISLARDTLKRSTGDCDDLTVLFCSLLETVGIETALVTVPGHIYMALNTGLPGRSYAAVHPDRSMTLNVNDELWIPVEVTIVGRGDFLSAWKSGASAYAAQDGTPRLRGFYPTREAQSLYRPVGLKESDLGLQYGDPARIAGRYRKELDRLVDVLVSDLAAKARENPGTASYNRLGIMYAKFNQLAKAKEAFVRALSSQPDMIEARVNLAGVLYLSGDIRSAMREYGAVRASFEARSETLSYRYMCTTLNLAQCLYDLGEFPEAGVLYAAVETIDPALASGHAHLQSGGKSSGRASGGGMAELIIFVDGS